MVAILYVIIVESLLALARQDQGKPFAEGGWMFSVPKKCLPRHYTAYPKDPWCHIET